MIILFKLALTSGLVYWLLDSGQMDFKKILEQPFSALHLAAIAILTVNFIIAGYRWFLLLTIQLPDVRLGRMIGWMWISEFFAMVTLGGGGGKLARSYYAIKNHPEARIAGFSSVLLDRLIGLLSLLFLGVASYGLFLLSGQQVTPTAHHLGAVTAILLLIAVLGSIALMASPTRRAFRRFISDDMLRATDLIMQSYYRQKAVVVYCFVLSLIAHLFLIMSFWVAADLLVIDMDYLSSLVVVPFTLIANFLPITPGGIGVGETTATFMFALFAVVNGGTMMAMVRLWLIILQLGGGLWYLLQSEDRLPRGQG